jgi:histidyl-tRNA synthetase
LQERNLIPKLTPQTDAFVIIEDETLRPESLGLVQQLRDAGLSTDYSLVPMKADKQFKRAQELNTRFTLRCVRKDDQTLCVIRDLRQQGQSEIPASQAADEIAKRR